MKPTLTLLTALLVITCGASVAYEPAPPSKDATPDRLRDLTAAWEPPRRTILGPFHNLYNARIVEEPGQEYPLRLWFFGWAVADSNPVGEGKHRGDAIYHARAKDLQHWEVFSAQPDGAPAWDCTGNPRLWTPVVSAGDRLYDNAANGDPSVVKRDGVYYMAFSSVGFEPHAGLYPQRLYIHNCIMGATSRDGIRWEKTKAPILAWDGEAANRWDIAGGKEGRPPDSYYGSYHRPSLLFDQGLLRLEARDEERPRVGLPLQGGPLDAPAPPVAGATSPGCYRAPRTLDGKPRVLQVVYVSAQMEVM